MSISDFKDANGYTDWDAYEADEVSKGNRCKTCGTYIIHAFSTPKGPKECYSCKTLEGSDDEVTHDRYVRCPRCGLKDDAADWWESGIYDDNDTTSIYCNECEYEYEVTTHIIYSYESPERLKL